MGEVVLMPAGAGQVGAGTAKEPASLALAGLMGEAAPEWVGEF